MELAGPDPGAAASDWIAFLRAGDFDTAWAATTTDFRVAHAQAWVTAHRGILELLPGNVKPDDLACALSGEEPDHEMSQYLRRDVERQVHKAVREILGGPGAAVSPRSRPIRADVELVHVSALDQLTSTEAIETGESGYAAASISILLRRAPKGWRIAASTTIFLCRDGRPSSSASPSLATDAVTAHRRQANRGDNGTPGTLAQAAAGGARRGDHDEWVMYGFWQSGSWTDATASSSWPANRDSRDSGARRF